MTDLSPRRIGRPPSCTCGECFKCKRARYMRAWWSGRSLEQKRAALAGRDPERVAAAEQKRTGSPLKIASVRRSQLRNVQKHYARQAVYRAIRSGRLVREACHCGAGRVEAHHSDYSRPLDVTWLCRRHHVETHRGEAAAWKPR